MRLIHLADLDDNDRWALNIAEKEAEIRSEAEWDVGGNGDDDGRPPRRPVRLAA